MLLSGAICGTVYALFSGQPLTIVGATGPLLVFESIIYQLCRWVLTPYAIGLYSQFDCDFSDLCIYFIFKFLEYRSNIEAATSKRYEQKTDKFKAYRPLMYAR